MKQFMTASAFFLSAAGLSIHTPSFAYMFDDIMKGAEKASNTLMYGRHHHHHSKQAQPSTIPDPTQANIMVAPLSSGSDLTPTAPAVGPNAVMDPLPTPDGAAGVSGGTTATVQPDTSRPVEPAANPISKPVPLSKPAAAPSPMPLTY